MEEPSSSAKSPAPWASPGYTPAQPGEDPTGYTPPGSAAAVNQGWTPGYEAYGSNYGAPAPNYGAPGPGYETPRPPAPAGQGNYTFPSLQKQPFEPLAIASVLTSPLAPVGLGLGIIARRRISRTLKRGQSLANTGIVLSTLFLVSALLAVGTLALNGTFARLVETPLAGDVSATRAGSPVNLDIGNCIVTLPVTTEVGEVTLTPCASEHQLQVIDRSSVAAGTYPGADSLHTQATDVCAAAFERINNSDSQTGQFIPWHLVPSEANWNAGEQNIICFARSIAGPITVDLLQ